MSQKSPLLSGGARDAVIAYLRANLNDSLSDPDVIRDDGISLEPISSESYFIDETFTPLKYPAIYVLAPKFTFDYSEGPNYVNGMIPLETTVVVNEITFDKIQRKAESYARAIFKTLDQVSVKDSAGRFQLKLISKEIEFSHTFTNGMSGSQKYYRKAAIYRWTAKHFENRLIP